MNIDIAGTDSIIGEYLIYRGFTQTFQSLELERGRDRTKRFEVSKIVETILKNLQNFEIENFISLWDFLNKRFFFHLDAEHVNLCGILKADLLKYYLVNAVKTKNKQKVNEFFSMYSHEILAESGNFIPGQLRAWFVLPYMDEPEKDPEFAAYFAQRWADLLKVTLHNFLSVVLSTAPPPKLLLLERWFRSEAQQEIRSQLKASNNKIETLVNHLESYEGRLHDLREVVKDLVYHMQKMNIGGSSRSAVFDSDEVTEGKREKAKEYGQTVLQIASDCAKKSKTVQAMQGSDKLKVMLGSDASVILDEKVKVSKKKDNSLDMAKEEQALVAVLQGWIKILSS